MAGELMRAPGAIHDTTGAPLFGTYRGAVATTSMDRVAQRLRLGAVGRVREEKRWQWWGVVDEELAAGAAIVRLGYASQVFFWCWDRARGVMLVDSERTLPPWSAQVSDDPMGNPTAQFQAPGSSTDHGSVAYRDGAVHLVGAMGEARWEIALDATGGPPPVSAICPVPRGRVNATIKQAGLAASGLIEVAGRRITLSSGALGLLDATHGLLARHTAWRWAIGAGSARDGGQLSFNMVAGFNDGLENVVWLDGEPHALGEVEIVMDRANPDGVWHVRGDQVALKLRVEGVRRASTDLLLVGSHYTQPIGVWSGHIKGRELGHVLGVAEDHLARW